MTDDYVATVRIRRPARVTTDGARNVWTDTIETADLELVSTTRLQAIIDSGDEESQGAIREALAGNQEGVLARDPATGLFEVISDEDLQTILDENENLPIRRKPDDITLELADKDEGGGELSLVSTQMLRKIIRNDQKPSKPAAGVKPKAAKDRSGGFDPYNSG